VNSGRAAIAPKGDGYKRIALPDSFGGIRLDPLSVELRDGQARSLAAGPIP
jgi:hypothetical protein